MPMLVPMTTWWPSSSYGWLIDCTIRRASTVTSDGVDTLVCSTANSSPPNRATVSLSRTMSRCRSATAAADFTDRMPQRVIDRLEPVEIEPQRANPLPRSACAGAWSSRSWNGTRLGSPVSGSCRARNTICSSERRRSEMSACVAIQPPSAIGATAISIVLPAGFVLIALVRWRD